VRKWPRVDPKLGKGQSPKRKATGGMLRILLKICLKRNSHRAGAKKSYPQKEKGARG